MTSKQLLATESVPCRLCGADEFSILQQETVLDGLDVAVVRCARCGLVYTSPRPACNTLALVYSEEHYARSCASGQYCLDGDITTDQFVRGIEVLSRFKDGGRLLDVGCGAGHFLEQVQTIGTWAVCGVDLSPHASQLARQRVGDHIHTGTLEDAAFADAWFDAVTMWSLLEHVPDPKSTLHESRRVLKEDGVLLVAVPNVEYLLLQRRIAQLMRRPFTLHPDEHLCHFSQSTLRAMLSRTGFRVIEEAVMAPFALGGKRSLVVKTAAFTLARLWLRLTGVNWGGLLVLAQPSQQRASVEEYS